MKNVITFWLIFLLCCRIASAQEVTLKHTVTGAETLLDIARNYNVSAEEIQELNPYIINGLKENDVLIIPKQSKNIDLDQQTIEYTVKTGDTKYSLARKFGISIADLESQNPHTVPMLKVGEVLRIGGNRGENFTAQNSTSYIVKSGDTKFGLSKKFGISIDQLEALNPQIVPTLMVGQTLSFVEKKPIPVLTTSETSVVSPVDVKENGNEKPNIILNTNSEKSILKEADIDAVKPSSNSGSYVSHTIQPGETLYGLSKLAGMSIDAFTELNPKLSTSVQAGMVIKMPSSNFTGVNGAYIPKAENVKSTSNYTDLRQTVIADKKKNLTFFLPFSEKQFVESNLDKNSLSDFVKYNRDFYRGALIAIDSAKSLGLNIDFDIVNIGSAKLSSELVTVAKNANIKSSDAIILPFYQNSIQDLAATVAENDVPVVTTSNLSKDKETPNLYEAVPSVYAQRKTMLDYLSSKNNSNLIVVNDESRSESRAFIAGNAPAAKFIQVKDNGVFNSERLIEMFQKGVKNYVVIDSDKKGVFISATNALLRETSNYSIQLAVLESSLIPDEVDVSGKRFVILEMLFPSIQSGKSSGISKTFGEVYKKQYFSEPVSMAAYGFDITFDTLLRLFQPENFEIGSKKITEYKSLKFQYSKNEWGYYSNFGVTIFQYEANDTHKQVK